jgi:3-methyladenine DNA glycosylase AlkD
MLRFSSVILKVVSLKAGWQKMKKTEVMALLKENRNERGVANWKRKMRSMKSFGIGLTQLRKLAKQVGRNHKLALQLWKSDIYDAQVMGLLIDDPKQVSREQAEEQVEELNAGMLLHVFASCDATLAKAPFAFELACDWMDSKDPVRRRCAYALVYELCKKNINAMDEAWFQNCIDHIRETIHGEEMWVRESMNGALLGIGKRNRKLNKAAILAVKAIGPVDVDYGDDNSCEPVDVLKHLTSDHLKKKFST